jgi:hypothetical protein
LKLPCYDGPCFGHWVQVFRNRCFRAGEGATEDANVNAGATVIGTVRGVMENGNCRMFCSILQILLEVCLFQSGSFVR